MHNITHTKAKEGTRKGNSFRGSKPNLIPGPDFMCIGLQKAGTGWLYDQLCHHPDFWMPPLKELRYFDSGGNVAKSAARFQKQIDSIGGLEKFNARQIERAHCPLGAKELTFLHHARETPRRGIKFDEYAMLFSYKEDHKSGDVTPGYSTLADELIEQIQNHFPHLRIILLLRDPIARAWSHLSMDYHHKRLPGFDPNDWNQVYEYLTLRKVAMRSYPSVIYKRWAKIFPPNQIMFFFFDDIVAKPQEVRERLGAFLEFDASASRFSLPANFNRKQRQIKIEMPAAIRPRVVEHFEQELRDCAAFFGGSAEQWLTRYDLG